MTTDCQTSACHNSHGVHEWFPIRQSFFFQVEKTKDLFNPFPSIFFTQRHGTFSQQALFGACKKGTLEAV
jgi:hypothetical protein